MAIVQKKYTDRIEVDLAGPQGNAFYLLGLAKKLCNQLEIDSSVVLDEMRESDYENLLSVFDKYFGKFVTLYR